MNANTIAVIIIAIFALVVVASFLRFRQRGKAEITGPFGTSVKVQGSNDPHPQQAGITAKGITSREGGVLAEDNTGQGVNAENIDAKGDVLLSNNNPIQPQTENLRQNTTVQVPNVLSASSMNAGGNITIQQFVGNEISLAQQLEYFIKQMGLENLRANRFENSQYQAYCDVWKNLQSLRLFGDDLWEKASHENLALFATQLRKTRTIVNEGEIFFEEADRENLLRILDTFGDFEIGKLRIIEIRSAKDVEKFGYRLDVIDKQIEKNRRVKREYEQILGSIRVSFKDRLSK